jgi:hypothetical protein
MPTICAFMEPEAILKHPRCEKDDEDKPYLGILAHGRAYKLYSYEPVEVAPETQARVTQRVGNLGGSHGVRYVKHGTDDDRILYERRMERIGKKVEKPAVSAPEQEVKVRVILPPKSVMQKLTLEQLRQTALQVPGAKITPAMTKAELVETIIAAAA